MKIINFNQSNNLFNQFLSEIRDVHIQGDRIRFPPQHRTCGRNHGIRNQPDPSLPSGIRTNPIGYSRREHTFRTTCGSHHPSCGTSRFIRDLSIILTMRKMPSFRLIVNTSMKITSTFIEYIASPRLDGKILILTDPMLATGSSMELAYEALLYLENHHIHIASVICQSSGHRAYQKVFPTEKPPYGAAPSTRELNAHSYIVPGLGDGGRFVLWRKRIKKKRARRKITGSFLFIMSDLFNLPRIIRFQQFGKRVILFLAETLQSGLLLPHRMSGASTSRITPKAIGKSGPSISASFNWRVWSSQWASH